MLYWLGRSSDGKWILCDRNPIEEYCGDEGERRDLYVRPGDMTGFRHICRKWISVHCPEALKMRRLEVVKVEIPPNTWQILE